MNVILLETTGHEAYIESYVQDGLVLWKWVCCGYEAQGNPSAPTTFAGWFFHATTGEYAPAAPVGPPLGNGKPRQRPYAPRPGRAVKKLDITKLAAAVDEKRWTARILAQKDVAAACGVSQNVISRLLGGRLQKVSHRTLDGICAWLEVDPSSFFTEAPRGA